MTSHARAVIVTQSKQRSHAFISVFFSIIVMICIHFCQLMTLATVFHSPVTYGRKRSVFDQCLP